MVFIVLTVLRVFVHVHLACLGVASFIDSYSELSHSLDQNGEDTEKPTCNKDTGSKKQLMKWTRGRLFVVRGGGHIDMWQPLYKYDIAYHVY